MTVFLLKRCILAVSVVQHVAALQTVSTKSATKSSETEENIQKHLDPSTTVSAVISSDSAKTDLVVGGEQSHDNRNTSNDDKANALRKQGDQHDPQERHMIMNNREHDDESASRPLVDDENTSEAEKANAIMRKPFDVDEKKLGHALAMPIDMDAAYYGDIQQSPSDGNCLYHSLLSILRQRNVERVPKMSGCQAKDEEEVCVPNGHLQMRTEIMDYIKNHSDDYVHFISPQDYAETTDTIDANERLEKFLKYHRTPGHWGNHHQIAAFEKKYDLNIGLMEYSKHIDRAVDRTRLFSPTRSGTSFENTDFWLHYDGAHYNNMSSEFTLYNPPLASGVRVTVWVHNEVKGGLVLHPHEEEPHKWCVLRDGESEEYPQAISSGQMIMQEEQFKSGSRVHVSSSHAANGKLGVLQETNLEDKNSWTIKFGENRDLVRVSPEHLSFAQQQFAVGLRVQVWDFPSEEKALDGQYAVLQQMRPDGESWILNLDMHREQNKTQIIVHAKRLTIAEQQIEVGSRVQIWGQYSVRNNHPDGSFGVVQGLHQDNKQWIVKLDLKSKPKVVISAQDLTIAQQQVEVGSRVRAMNLKYHKRLYNGKIGTVQSYDEQKNKWKVKFFLGPKSFTITMRPQDMFLVLPPLSSSSSSSSPATPSRRSFRGILRKMNPLNCCLGTREAVGPRERFD